MRRKCFWNRDRIKNLILVRNLIFITGTVAFFFSCSELYFSAYECEGEECLHSTAPRGNTDLLFKPPVDILIVKDNTSKMRPLNPSLTMSLNSFLKCMEPADWRMGMIVSGSPKKNQAHKLSTGQLLKWEHSGRLLPQRALSARTPHYPEVFSDTVSLASGCHLPPYCGKGDPRPLTALKTFASPGRQGSRRRFLRERVPLVSIIISSSDEDYASLSQRTQAEETLSAIQRLSHFYMHRDHFMNITVTASGTANDCISTPQDYVEKGLGALSMAGTLYAMVQVEPLVFLGSVLLSGLASRFSRGGIQQRQKHKEPEKRVAIADLAQSTGGYLMDLCNPDFGKALAFATLQHIQKEDLFSKECQTIRKSASRPQGKDVTLESVSHRPGEAQRYPSPLDIPSLDTSPAFRD